MTRGNPLKKFKWSVENVLFNKVCKNPESIENFLLLVAKTTMYANRCLKKTTTKDGLRQKFLEYKNIEHYNAMKTGKIRIYYKKWYGMKEKCREENTITNLINTEDLARQYIIESMIC